MERYVSALGFLFFSQNKSRGTCWPSSEGVGDASNPGPGRVEGATRVVSSLLTTSGIYIAAA